ncbi:uncharacterized protein FIESC28_06934 [Fusarium coffeatum]|uniref:Heterokaryon incompatibility domain-containing protein n=1 Tax=Fusarium coffeatum TaxID=231269 RepID=A0A366RJR0_9HYPO|nr:uncharacterized protein FIESC28_06934 [Fusarium coffeatum]RBR16525.1 hypothetical protein FIESC28_06934 [Fusarium coffeatum]
MASQQSANAIDCRPDRGREPVATSIPVVSYLAQRLLGEEFMSDGYSSIDKTKALIWAVGHNHVPLVEELIAYGVDVNMPGVDGWTCLGIAAELPTPKVLDILLRAGADVTAICGFGGKTALHWAARAGRSQAVKTLISQGSKVDTRISKLGFSPLHDAAYKGHVDTVQALLEAGAIIQCVDNEGWSPLHAACCSGHPDAVQLLIDRGASISSTTTGGLTPLHVAAVKAKHEIVMLICAIPHMDEAGENVLVASVTADSVATARVVLDHGANIETSSSDGITPLASAVLCNALEMASFLLEYGADIEGQTDDGYTALHLAAEKNLQQMSQLLIEKSANIESRITPGNQDGRLGDEGLTPLLAAAKSRSIDTAHILVNHGANAEATDKGWTGIHFASFAQSKSLIRLFAQEGVSIDARTLEQGRTALIVASAGDNPEVVALLIKLGADVDATNNIGWTPLHFAAHGGSGDITETLLKNGANPAAVSLDGERPRDVAYRQQNHHVRELIDGVVSVSLDAQNKPRARSVSLLFQAARANLLDKTLQLLDGEININSCDRDDRSSLSFAAESGSIGIVKALTSRKADMNLQDSYGGTPLWWASKCGHAIVVEHLLEQGAHCDTPDADGQSPLSVSSQYGHLTTVLVAELLSDSGADVNYRNPLGDSILRRAEVKKHKEVSDVLEYHQRFLKSESDQWDGDAVGGGAYPREVLDSISPLTFKRYTPLLKASKKGQLAMIERLIKAGADPNLSIDRRSALDEAAAFGQSEAVATLVEHGASVNGYDKDRSPLTSAAFNGHSNVIKLLCDLGASIDRGHEWGYSALMDAAECGHEVATSLLLQLGAKSDTRDKYGRTPLWHATKKRFGNVVKLLVESGANLECADNKGCTPLMIAVKRRDRKLTQFLLEKGSQMRPDSKRNYSPLCYAARNGDEPIVDLLLDYGADVNLPSFEKCTALHIATFEGHIMVIKMLIEADADVSLKDADGRTALSLAKENSNDAAITLLCRSASLRYAYCREYKKADATSFNEKSSYKYQPLTTASSIRIIELYPGNPGEILSFELEEVPLAGTTSFDALSYEWQEKVGTVPVQCGDRKILITPNCKAAMEKLRLRNKSRHLWIDAVCINQSDDHERNQQVGIMGEIFRTADKVIMWLGEETKFMAQAFEELPMIAKAQRKLLQEAGELAVDGESSEGDEDHGIMLQRMSTNEYIVGAFEDLMGLTYWTRAWILPEIIIAGSKGIVMCGDQSCDWSTLRLGMPRYEFCGFGQTPAIFDSSLADEYEKEGELRFVDVVDVLHTLDATDIRDKVFASLGVASSANELVERPIADYTMSVQQVFVYATRYIIDSHSLWSAWTLGIRHSTKQVCGLPSWVPDFNQRPSCEGEELFGHSCVLCRLDIVEAPITTDTSLHIGGCILDRVVFKLKLTKDLEISTILLLVVEALGKGNQSIYDLYTVGDGFDINSTIVDQKDRMQSIRSMRMSTNAGALIDTIFRLQRFPCNGDDGVKTGEDIADEAFSLLLGYMVWTLSRKVDALETPDYAKQAANPWFEESTNAETFTDFEIDNLVLMEGLLRYGNDLIYTENGYFGLTNAGEADDGMSIALVGHGSTFRLLRKRGDSEPYYEYVDLVSINLMGQEIDKPEKAYKNINLERLEFR